MQISVSSYELKVVCCERLRCKPLLHHSKLITRKRIAYIASPEHYPNYLFRLSEQNSRSTGSKYIVIAELSALSSEKTGLRKDRPRSC